MVWYDVLPAPAVSAVEGLFGGACFEDVVGRFNFSKTKRHREKGRGEERERERRRRRREG